LAAFDGSFDIIFYVGRKKITKERNQKIIGDKVIDGEAFDLLSWVFDDSLKKDNHKKRNNNVVKKPDESADTVNDGVLRIH